MIVLETFTLGDKVYHKGDKIENVSQRLIDLGLVSPEKSSKVLTEEVKPAEEVLLTEDTSDVEVEVEEKPVKTVKPLKKTK
jgi:hypothetical protein